MIKPFNIDSSMKFSDFLFTASIMIPVIIIWCFMGIYKLCSKQKEEFKLTVRCGRKTCKN